MAIFALVRNEIVTNYIVADSLNEVTTAFPDDVVIEMTEELTPAYIHGRWDGVRFYPPAPGPDWQWNDEIGEWVAPLPDTVLGEIGDE